MNRPIFSIITPTFNRGHLLPRIWESLKNQAFRDFEWIIIDDGSTDNTKEIVNSFNDPRLVFERFPQNRGVNAARNKGLDLARGKYVFYVDSDDLLLPNALEIFLKLWNEVPEDVGCIITPCLDLETKKKIGFSEKEKMYLNYEDIVCERKISGEMNACWKREIIGNERLPEEIIGCEAILWWRLAKKTKIFFCDIPTKLYSQAKVGRLSSSDKIIQNASKMIKGYEILVQEHSDVWKKYCPDRYCHYLNSLALRNLFIENKKEARKWLKLSLKVNHFSIQTLFLYFLSFTNMKIIITAYTFYHKIKIKFQ
jgi:glycosyltransferase involved in cell wall biosynthesis